MIESSIMPADFVADNKERHIPGEAGVWVLISGDMIIFALLFGVYGFYRAVDIDTFLASQSLLNQNYGALNTLFLLTSSLFVVLAMQAIRNNRQSLAPPFLASALACGMAFSIVKFIEYNEKWAQGYTLVTDDFFMFYYVLTAIHFLHVVIGMALLAFLIKLTMKKEFTRSDYQFLEGGACFWHMVDLLWIVLFPLIYLMK